MAVRNPLVLISGDIEELPSGDTVNGAGGGYTIVNQSSTPYNATQTSGHVIILCDCTSNAITVNLPTAVGNTAKFDIKKTDSSANAVTIDGDSTESIDGSATASLAVANVSVTLVSDNSNWKVI